MLVEHELPYSRGNVSLQVQPDMITLDTSSLGLLDTQTLQQQLEEKKKLLVSY